MKFELYSCFPEQVYKGVIRVAPEGYEASYFGIDQHLGTEHTW